MSRPTINWEEAPLGTTHAIWGPNSKCWYFRYVDAFGSVYRNSPKGWIKLVDQTLSRRFIEEGRKIPNTCSTPAEPKRKQTMNLNNAALLVRDDIQTVKVSFGSETKYYTFILHNSITVEEADFVIVTPNGGHPKVAQVMSIDEEPDIDVNLDSPYRWIICNITKQLEAIKVHQEFTDKLAEGLKRQKRKSLREQILAQYGVSSTEELLKLNAE